MFCCILNISEDAAVGAEVPCCTKGLSIPCSCKGDADGWEEEFCLMSANVPRWLSACGGFWRWVFVRCIKVYFVYFQCPKCRSFEVLFFLERGLSI